MGWRKVEYQNIKFDAIMATPGLGKSYVCDRDKRFIDADEERLKCKYVVPENISREDLERTKGDRPFEKRAKHDEYIKALYDKLDNYVDEGKIIIAAPHPEFYEYFKTRNIKFVFIYPSKNMRQEIKDRMKERGNDDAFIKENDDKFEEFYKLNREKKQSVLHYEARSGEFLSDIIKKFGIK